jgi:hypothetical protein
LDLWFESYEVFKILTEVWACCQPLPMQQNLTKTTQICQNLPKDDYEIPQKIKILVFFKNKNFYV